MRAVCLASHDVKPVSAHASSAEASPTYLHYSLVRSAQRKRESALALQCFNAFPAVNTVSIHLGFDLQMDLEKEARERKAAQQ